MVNTYEFQDAQQSRAFWHHLLDQMGADRFFSQCSIRAEAGTIIITVRHD